MKNAEFRGLNGDKTEWIYADLSNVSPLFQHNGVWKDTVGQYIRKKDKNGKKIYQGDIVSFHYDNGLDDIGYIFWEDCGFYLRPKRNKDWSMNLAHANNIEVIGTIHQNKELYEEIEND